MGDGVGELGEGGDIHGDQVGGQLVLGDVHERAVVRAVHIHLMCRCQGCR